MTEAVKLLTFISIIFVMTLMIAGSLGGALGDAVYYLAFAAPIFIGFRASERLKYDREEEKGLAESPDSLFTFDKKRAFLLLPLIIPAVILVMISSMISALLLSLIGVDSVPVAEEGLIKMLTVHALIPAVLEEALFRYIPMKLLMPYSKRWCVIYSAFCFALIHCSFPQMPYAFIAGVIFMVIDIAFGSVWPSVILHFLNNTTSVISMKYCTDIPSMLIFFGIMMLICTVSLFFTYKRKEEYMHLISGALDKGDSFAVGYAPFALALICCCVALTSI